MKMYVSAKVNDSKLKWPSGDYIDDAKKHDVNCKINNMDLGLFTTKYKLTLEGSEENIKSFLSYLKMLGFKIKEF